MLIVVKYLHFLTILGFVFGKESWDYSQNGRDWGGVCSTGRKQSPININTKLLTVANRIHPIIYTNYDRFIPCKVGVGHHTVKVTPVVKYRIFFTDDEIPGHYRFNHLHFHWPAEHLIDGQRPILEAHFVHINEKYNSIADAIKDPAGIAVISLLFLKGKAHFGLSQIIRAARNKKTLKLNLFYTLPRTKDSYRYRGSLTTPGCHESVVWNIFREYEYASPCQIYELRKLMPHEERAVDIFRVPQSRGIRNVILLREPHVKSKAHYFHANPFILFTIIPIIYNTIQFPHFIKKYV